MSQSINRKPPDRLVAILVGEHQETAAGGMDDLARQVQQVMANRLDRRPMVAGGQHQALEPRHQIKGQLADEEVGPVGMEFLGGQLLQAKATLMFLDRVLHRGMLQVPHDDRPGGAHPTESSEALDLQCLDERPRVPQAIKHRLETVRRCS